MSGYLSGVLAILGINIREKPIPIATAEKIAALTKLLGPI